MGDGEYLCHLVDCQAQDWMKILAHETAQNSTAGQYFRLEWDVLAEAFAHYCLLKSNYMLMLWLSSSSGHFPS